MNINRNNYEEHFILYWDNELTATQKQAVENFVKENSDLQEEFKLLGETRFVADNNLRFEEKEFLLNDSFINITNYEEQLLDYIDNELNDTERKEVEKFAATNSTIQKELAMLQRTKLQPEAIAFPDKSILYRREEKVRVISMTWFRVAVAAAIILIAGFATIRIINNNKSGDKIEVAKNTSSDNPDPANKNSTEQPLNNPQGVADPEKNLASTPSTPEKDDQKPIDENKIADNIVAVNNNSNGNNLPKEGARSNPTIIDQNNSGDKALASNDNQILIPKDINNAQRSDLEKTNDPFDKSFVTNTSRITSDNIDVPEEAEETSKGKGGLKQFLRKTTRVFERRTKIQTTTEDNKLLLGAFAVSLK